MTTLRLASGEPNTLSQLRAIAAEYGALAEMRDHLGMGQVIHFWREGNADIWLDVLVERIDTTDIRGSLHQAFGEPVKASGLNFANHPKSIGEIKAERDEDSRTWAPRDALISLLREIDSGLTKPTDLVICYIERDPEDGGATKSRYLNATSDLPTALGLLNRIQFRLNTGGPA
jgi:hypothetical protein